MSALIIHGGLAKHEGGDFTLEHYSERLRIALRSGYDVLCRTSAMEAVLHTVSLLEDDPTFNAGTGSRIQRDGKVRMTAALMDSDIKRFSGVINVRNIKNPIRLAERLRKEEHTVLSGDEAMEFAFENGFDFHDPITEYRRKEFMGQVCSFSGTVGAIAVDEGGRVVAGTSTGGIGHETAGRMSDSGTVAGTYASKEMGISCTGRGEDITRYAVASRIVAFNQAGLSPLEASEKLKAEADDGRSKFSYIGLCNTGTPVAAGVGGTMPMYAFKDSSQEIDFLSEDSIFG